MIYQSAGTVPCCFHLVFPPTGPTNQCYDATVKVNSSATEYEQTPNSLYNNKHQIIFSNGSLSLITYSNTTQGTKAAFTAPLAVHQVCTSTKMPRVKTPPLLCWFAGTKLLVGSRVCCCRVACVSTTLSYQAATTNKWLLHAAVISKVAVARNSCSRILVTALN